VPAKVWRGICIVSPRAWRRQLAWASQFAERIAPTNLYSARPRRLTRLLLVAASTVLPACGQSILPSATQPARAIPAKVTSPAGVTRAAPGTLLRRVSILRGKTSVEVRIETSAPAKPAVLLLSGPERIVVDLPGVSCGGGHRFSVDTGDVQAVRVALFQSDPPITRVVVDLTHRHEYRLMPSGSTVILAVDFTPPAAAQVTPAKVAAVEATNPALPAASPHLPSNAVQLPAPGSVAGWQPPAVAQPEATARASAGPPPPAMQPSAPTPATGIPPTATSPVSSGKAQAPAISDEETTPHQAAKANKPGVVRSVTVSREKDAIAVHIEGSKPLQASVSALSDPNRIIIDLADVRLNHPRRIAVNAAEVQAVSASLFLVNPLVTRVIVGLAHPHAYHLQTFGNSLTVLVETGDIKAAGSAPVP